MSLTFWIVVAVVIVVGFALAWWSSGRAKGQAFRRGRHDGEASTMEKYRPSTGTGPGSGIGGGGPNN